MNEIRECQEWLVLVKKCLFRLRALTSSLKVRIEIIIFDTIEAPLSCLEALKALMNFISYPFHILIPFVHIYLWLVL